LLIDKALNAFEAFIFLLQNTIPMKSMTGYGNAVLDTAEVQISVEIKCLNSKFFDAQLRIPRAFIEKEIEIRNILSESLDRGKISLSIDFQKKTNESPKISINNGLFNAYFTLYNQLADQVSATKDELFKLALQSPDVIVPEISEKGIEDDYMLLKDTLSKAIAECEKFRASEGKTLQLKVNEYVEHIRHLLGQIEGYEQERLDNVKNKLRSSLRELVNDNEYNKDRFEQELIYYIEKLDFHEEKVRLASHLDYFKKSLNEPGAHGKKLGFVAQELGREINTIGSKANHAGIQRIVVQMKEELEKIKEQILNVL
jgi:uncharacterized protein (TIGR00255 family)